jgi:hypothetical protein
MPQIQKQQFRNQSGGYIGVVVIGPDGHERGAAVEPDGTVWLTEQEQILTANAPRLPEDNPFIEQMLVRRDPDTDAEVEVPITPLIPISEQRFVPANVRPIASDLVTPGAAAAALANQTATAEEPIVYSADGAVEERLAEVDEEGEDAKPRGEFDADVQHTFTPQGTVPPVPPRAAAAAAAAQEEEPVTEETAAQVDPAIGEETGAAVTPTTDAPQGEYAALEEVGTPDAPTAPPAPWSPGSGDPAADAAPEG